ncbi:MAG: helix-turn-helix transcriptional regulator [Terrisporobacter sp.]
MKKRNIIGDKLKKYRTLNNLSQRAFITKLSLCGLNLDQATLARIETHNREVYDYELLYFSKVLHIDINDLYEDVDLDYK